MLDAFVIEQLRKENQEKERREWQPVQLPLEQPGPEAWDKNVDRSETPDRKEVSEVVRIVF